MSATKTVTPSMRNGRNSHFNGGGRQKQTHNQNYSNVHSTLHQARSSGRDHGFHNGRKQVGGGLHNEIPHDVQRKDDRLDTQGQEEVIREVLYHPPPTSMTLSAALLLLELPRHLILGDDENEESGGRGTKSEGKFSSKQGVNSKSMAMTPPRKLSIMSSSQSIELSYGRNSHKSSLSTGMSNREASTTCNAKEDSDDEHEEEDMYVYLLPRPWLENWTRWALHQPVPSNERSRTRVALRKAAEMYGLSSRVISSSSKCTCGCQVCLNSLPPSLEEAWLGTGGGPARSGSMSCSCVCGAREKTDFPGTNNSNAAPLPSPTMSRKSVSGANEWNTNDAQQQLYSALSYRKPGPIDASPLSTMGHPLVLRPNVVVGTGSGDAPTGVGSGGFSNSSPVIPLPSALVRGSSMTRGDDSSIKSSGSPGMKSPYQRSHSMIIPLRRDGASSCPTSPTRRSLQSTLFDNCEIGCCPVSERFYDYIRTIHGVLCSDHRSVSFQRSSVLGNRSRGSVSSSRNGRRRARGASSSVVVLHHHKFQASSIGGDFDAEESMSALPPTHNERPPSQISFLRRRLSSELAKSGSCRKGSLAPRDEIGTSCVPIEFRRPMIRKNRENIEDDVDMDKVSKKKKSESNLHVEVYPVKFLYSLVDSFGENQASPQKGSGHQGDTGLESGPKSDVALDMSCDGNIKPYVTTDEADCVEEKGFVLISRSSSMRGAVQALLRTVAPDKSAACVRCWIRYGLPGSESAGSNASASGRRSLMRRRTSDGNRCVTGTALGDGYELWTDVDQQMPASSLAHGASNPVVDRGEASLDDHTVEKWMSLFAPSALRSGVGGQLEFIVETRANLNTEWRRQYMTLGQRIQVGDFIDAKDSMGKWYESVVREVRETTLRVHYAGWSSRWDSWIQRFDDNSGKSVEKTSQKRDKIPGPPKALWSHTSKWRQNIKVGKDVEVREAASLVERSKWFRATIVAIGSESDPLRVVVGGAKLELYDVPDNSTDDSSDGSPRNLVGKKDRTSVDALPSTGRKAPFILLNRRQQVLVEVPQEKFNSPLPAKKSSIDPSTGAPKPCPPFIRWVNLYGEEICDSKTHNVSSEGASRAPATIKYAHDPSRAPVEVLRPYSNLLGAGFVRESIRGIPPAPGSVGLHNLGNSCFLNSILQCLNHIEPLTQYFLKGEYRVDLNKSNPLGSGGRVALVYAALLNDMWSGEYATLAPRMLKTTVAQFAPQFNNSFQHDSQEFCSFLMDGLHEDLNRVEDKPYVEDLEGVGMSHDWVAIESWKKHLLRHDSIVVDNCQGMHRSHLTCPDCGNESVKFDVFSTISLPLPQKSESHSNTHLEACLSAFTSVEQLDANNAWFCPKCKRHVCAKKLISLWSTPDILVLHLKRFTFNNCSKHEGRILRSKIENKVIFPVEGLDMSPYIIGPIDDDAPPVYKLFGVSEHSGYTANSGHYTATVRNSLDGKWYRYNDSHVGITSADAAITGGAYVLFYQRSKGKSRWAGMARTLKQRGIDPYTPTDTKKMSS